MKVEINFIKLQVSRRQFLKIFIYFLRERDTYRALAGDRQRERETQNLKQAPGFALSA